MVKKDAESESGENSISWMEFDKFEQKKLNAPDLWEGAFLYRNCGRSKSVYNNK